MATKTKTAAPVKKPAAKKAPPAKQVVKVAVKAPVKKPSKPKATQEQGKVLFRDLPGAKPYLNYSKDYLFFLIASRDEEIKSLRQNRVDSIQREGKMNGEVTKANARAGVAEELATEKTRLLEEAEQRATDLRVELSQVTRRLTEKTEEATALMGDLDTALEGKAKAVKDAEDAHTEYCRKNAELNDLAYDHDDLLRRQSGRAIFWSVIGFAVGMVVMGAVFLLTQ